MSLDEAYLDITDFLEGRKGQPPVKHQRIRYTGLCLLHFTIIFKSVKCIIGDCVCRLPCVSADASTDAPSEQTVCQQCNEVSTAISDEIEFGSSAEEVTNEMRFLIEQKTGLTASAGSSE